MPMFMRRVMGSGAPLVCSVDNTRCPVSAALRAISAVSKSQTSPPRIMLGSWRRKARRAAAKFRPICSFICTWLTPPSWNSTGSSAVMMVFLGENDLVRLQRGHHRGELFAADFGARRRIKLFFHSLASNQRQCIGRDHTDPKQQAGADQYSHDAQRKHIRPQRAD